MSESDQGIKLEFSTKQALSAATLLGLIVGLSFGFAAGAVTFQDFDASSGDSTPAGDGGDSQQGEEDTTYVSMDNINLDDRPALGDSDAPVKIVEYSDFGCPFCAEWQGVDASPQIPISDMQVADNLKDNYIDTGEVELIHKDFPVDNLHPNAPDAHTVANCVYEEYGNEAFWDFHDQLYEQRDGWTSSGQNNPEGTFRSIAENQGLNADSLMQCLEDTGNDAVQESRQNALAEFGNMGTPTFYVGTEAGEYIQISGAQPIERFEAVIAEVQN